MLYLFVYLSVSSPAFFLQSRVLDTPLAPTIGALTLCMFDVCAVIPRHGTTLYDFVQEIPPIDSLTNHVMPRAGSTIVDVMGGDDDDVRGKCKGPERRPHAPPFFLAQTPHRPNIEPFTWDAFQVTETGHLTSSFAHHRFSDAVPLNTTQKPKPAIGLIELQTQLTSPNLTLPQGLWSDREKTIALINSGGLGRNGSLFNVIANDIKNHALSHSRAPPVHVTSTRPPSRTSYLPTLPQCLRSAKAYYLLNMTCPYIVASNATRNLPRSSPSSTMTANPSTGSPQCLLSDKALHFLNDTCLTSSHPPPMKATVGVHAVHQPWCLLADKALHLLNGTCVLTSANETPKPTVKAGSPSSGAIPFRPISVFSLPCLASDRVHGGAPRNCGSHASPSTDTALDLDTRIMSQAARLKSHVAETTPIFFTTVADPEPPTYHKRRDFGTGARARSIAADPNHKLPVLTTPASQPQEPTTPFNYPRLHYIGVFCVTVAITLTTICVVGFLAGQVGQLQGIGTEDLPVVVKVEGTPEIPVVVKVEETPAKRIAVEAANFNNACEDVPVATTRRRPPVITERRVQPARKCKSLSLSEATLSIGTGRKKDRNLKARRS